MPRPVFLGLALLLSSAAILPVRGAVPEPPKIQIVYRPLARADAPAPEISSAEFSAALLAATNEVRREHRLPPLKALPTLDLTAEDQAEFMAFCLQVRHDNPYPGRKNAFERMRSRDLWPRLAGENLLSTGFDSAAPCATLAAQLVAIWMDSPPHRADLLNREFTHCGSALRRATLFGTGHLYVAQVFAAF